MKLYLFALFWVVFSSGRWVFGIIDVRRRELFVFCGFRLFLCVLFLRVWGFLVVCFLFLFL